MSAWEKDATGEAHWQGQGGQEGRKFRCPFLEHPTPALGTCLHPSFLPVHTALADTLRLVLLLPLHRREEALPESGSQDAPNLSM